ncbi:hypothetical protein QJQ45_020673 [Haematococcus lacustris]|nr:hypothetical protein QJQ45_020673 [Haematococcus lacustris]
MQPVQTIALEHATGASMAQHRVAGLLHCLGRCAAGVLQSPAAPSCSSASGTACLLLTRHISKSAACSNAEPVKSQPETAEIGNAKVQRLAEEVLSLTVLESSWLTEIIRKRLNLQKPAYGAMPAFPVAGAGVAAAAPAAASGAPAAAAEPAPEPKKEKTDFDVKLESFTPEGKIKVIKEIRAITNLGLKEAKELVRAPASQLCHGCVNRTGRRPGLAIVDMQVEKAPVVVKANVPKAEAENMKKSIEAGKQGVVTDHTRGFPAPLVQKWHLPKAWKLDGFPLLNSPSLGPELPGPGPQQGRSQAAGPPAGWAGRTSTSPAAGG